MSEQIKKIDLPSLRPFSGNYIYCNFLPVANLVFIYSGWWTHSLGVHYKRAWQKGVEFKNNDEPFQVSTSPFPETLWAM